MAMGRRQNIKLIVTLFLVSASIWLSAITLQSCGGGNNALSNFASGRFILFTSDRPKASGQQNPNDSDIYLYDRLTQSLVPLPGLNSGELEFGTDISPDGRFIYLMVGPIHLLGNPDIRIYDRSVSSFVDLPDLKSSRGEGVARATPDGRYIVFHREDGGFINSDTFLMDLNIHLYDRLTQSFISLPGLNSTLQDRYPAISADGRFIVFGSNRKSTGDEDIYLYDRQIQSLVPLPNLNSNADELPSSISGDGNFIAFSSNRSGGIGGSDIYLYDRRAQSFIPLPGLNSEWNEVAPFLSLDARFIVFSSDRPGGEGNMDIYLYDRQTQSLVPLPGLNSPYWDGVPVIRP